MSSELLPQYGLAIMRSNRWPGAVAFAKDRWATKHAYNYIVTSFPDQVFKLTILLLLVFLFVICSEGVWGMFSQ